MSKRRGETSTTAEDTLIGLPTGVDGATDYGKSPRGGIFHQVDYNAINNAYQHDGENRESPRMHPGVDPYLITTLTLCNAVINTTPKQQ